MAVCYPGSCLHPYRQSCWEYNCLRYWWRILPGPSRMKYDLYRNRNRATAEAIDRPRAIERLRFLPFVCRRPAPCRWPGQERHWLRPCPLAPWFQASWQGPQRARHCPRPRYLLFLCRADSCRARVTGACPCDSSIALRFNAGESSLWAGVIKASTTASDPNDFSPYCEIGLTAVPIIQEDRVLQPLLSS